MMVYIDFSGCDFLCVREKIISLKKKRARSFIEGQVVVDTILYQTIF
jgi:hypothetical protein